MLFKAQVRRLALWVKGNLVQVSRPAFRQAGLEHRIGRILTANQSN
ncbi:MAG: hypothetical protein HWE15_04895 [Algoriphagus sp.]|nr:hypothetical protein [Algoriphagus sp.]NVJ85619.1 hypothetical protein [Algoriphagus sp.]